MTFIPEIRHQMIKSTNLMPIHIEQSLFYIKTKSNMPNFSKASRCTK